jgi:hypothetical protein
VKIPEDHWGPSSILTELEDMISGIPDPEVNEIPVRTSGVCPSGSLSLAVRLAITEL